jgi:NAD+--asparagine ADP-ribosyltransferase
MSKRKKWIGITLAVIGIAIGSHYVRAAVSHHGPNGTTAAAAAVSPAELARAAKSLPVTVVESYF